MASLNSWLSPAVMRALGWALIHSLWQCLAVAALAALLMAFSRRPPLRYMIAVSALAVMLATPAATFFVLMNPAAPVQIAASPMPPGNAAFVLDDPSRPRVALGRAPLRRSTLEMVHWTISSAGPRLLPWLVAAWLAGVAFFSLRFAGGFLLLEHRRRSRSSAPNPRILALCQDLQRQLGIARAIRYLECSWLQAPAVIGWLRPMVLLPVRALTGLSEAQLKAVIAHELAHIRRLDVFVNLFQVFVEALLFYHPAVWWLNRRIRAERELCCDEIALEVSGDRLDYAKALTLMAAWEAAPRLAMAANSGVLSERVFHVLGRPSSGIGQRMIGQKMIGMAASMLFLAAALASANALFGAGSAIPIAQAGESVKITLQTALSNVSDRARQIFPAGEPAGKDASKTGVASKVEPAKDTAKLTPPPADLSQLLPKQTLSTPAVTASLDARTANRLAPAPPVAASSNGPGAQVCHNSSVSGRVISPTAIQLQGFVCILQENRGVEPVVLTFGSCPYVNENPYAYSITTSNRFGRFACKFDVTMGVRLADPADAALMQPGKIVTLGGDFRVATQNRSHYLAVANAKFVKTDPFDQAAAQPAAKNSPPAPTVVVSRDGMQSAQPAGSTPATQGPDTLYRCSNRNVYGVAISPTVIKMPGFSCFLGVGEGSPESLRFNFGPCPLASTYLSLPNYRPSCKWDVTMNVRLAEPADGAKMIPGKLVRLAGNFRVTMENHIAYLAVTDAKVIWSDPFSRLAKVVPRESSATPAATPPPDAPAASAPPPTVQASLSVPPAEMSPVHFCRNRSVFGQVTAANTVALQGFTCFVDGNPTDTVSARDIPLGACPLASSTTSYKLKCKFDVVLNVRLANPADAHLMVPGKLVRLGGNFLTWKEDKLDYVAVTNAKVLFTDYYWMGGVSSLPLPMGPPNFSSGNSGTSDNIVTQPSFSNGPAPQ